MSNRHVFRAVTACALVTALGLVGCAKTPGGLPMAAIAGGEVDALSKPVNQDAQGIARAWQADATQVGAMVNRSPRGVQDQATYIFASGRASGQLLLVIASGGGLQAKAIAVSERTAEAMRGVMPMTRQQASILNSKKIFAAADKAGLAGAEDTVVLNARGSNGTEPIALVRDAAGKRFVVLNAVTGEPMTQVQTAGARRVQFVVLPVVAMVVAVGAAVSWGVAEWRQHHGPTPDPKPTSVPTPPPAPTPVPTPVPTSHPATDVGQILAGPFGQLFDRLDTDHDGQLTLAEYLMPAPDDTTIKVKTQEFQQFIDPRNAGKVDRNTFLAGIERSVENKCSMNFSMLDANQDGGLDANELTGELTASQIQAADTNHDGKLSQAEYLVPFAQNEASFAAYYK